VQSKMAFLCQLSRACRGRDVVGDGETLASEPLFVEQGFEDGVELLEPVSAK
jgi:hypothetical protein